jgi:hypothetical protein
MAAMLFAFEIVLEIGNAMLDWPVQYLLCVCVGGGGGVDRLASQSRMKRAHNKGVRLYGSVRRRVKQWEESTRRDHVCACACACECQCCAFLHAGGGPWTQCDCH